MPDETAGSTDHWLAQELGRILRQVQVSIADIGHLTILVQQVLNHQAEDKVKLAEMDAKLDKILEDVSPEIPQPASFTAFITV